MDCWVVDLCLTIEPADDKLGVTYQLKLKGQRLTTIPEDWEIQYETRTLVRRRRHRLSELESHRLLVLTNHVEGMLDKALALLAPVKSLPGGG